MPDALFADARLAAIYDDIEGDRPDLDVYEAIIAELGARRVLDVGCGTGSLACRLAGAGLDVIGLDPASASLNIARSKPNAVDVDWIHGTAADLDSAGVRAIDLAVMTGNVAQVFVTDEDWLRNLMALRRALRGGMLVFETRDPDAEAWADWEARKPVTVETSAGPVRCTLDVTGVDLPLVSFRWSYTFTRTSEMLVSDSTLRFRSRAELAESLSTARFTLDDIRDAPDRPGKELVIIASALRRRSSEHTSRF